MTALTEKDWGRIFAKAWTDPAFAAAYEADPRAAIRAYGKDMDIDPEATFSLTSLPAGTELETLKAIAEGDADPQPMYCC